MSLYFVVRGTRKLKPIIVLRLQNRVIFDSSKADLKGKRQRFPCPSHEGM